MTILNQIQWHIRRKFNSIVFFFRFLLYPYVKIEGIKIPVDYKWSFPLLKALYLKEYEGGELNILKQTLEKTDRVLEIGAGLGFLSAYCAKKLGKENIKSFEANPSLEKIIRRLYKINRVQPDLTIALVADNEIDSIFFIEPNDIWASSMLKLSDTAIETQLKTLDINHIIAQFQPNYLVMDIEGAEYELLPKTNLDNINKIQLELHQKFLGKDKVNSLVCYLIEKGFCEKKELTTDEQFYFERK